MPETQTSATWATGHEAAHAAEPPTFFDPIHFPAHQFEDADQQREAATLGMWAFLATEVLLFGGLFICYIVYRTTYFEGFAHASSQMNVLLGTVNTGVLLTSSLTVALAIHAAQTGNNKWVVRYLLITIVLGLAFLGIKAVEYHEEYEHGLIPWWGWWNPHHANPEYEHGMKIFMILYFVMTGTHAAHMVVGMSLLAWIAFKAKRGAFSKAYYTPIEMSGLYWHFVDIVWVFLVPTLYLIHRHP